MLRPEIKKQLQEIFSIMQETAFAAPIRKSADCLRDINTGKFTRLLPFTDQWFISLCLTVSPEDDDRNHFWAASLAYVSQATRKPKSRFLWTNKETVLANELLSFLLEEVGLFDEEAGFKNKVRIFGKQVALHAHKDLSEVEKQALEEILEPEMLEEKGLVMN